VLLQVYYRKKKERQLQKEAELAGKTVSACVSVWLSGSVAALFECPRVCCCHSNAYDYTVKIGDMLGGRYRVIESLGKVRFVCDVRLVFVVRGFTCT
jgi:hypothetical protein